MTVIARFNKEFRWLSNFYPASIEIDGIRWATSEHYYQGQKSIDDKQQVEIREADTPAKAKKLGQRCTVRSDWNEIKYGVMMKALHAKFTQHPDLRTKLLETGDMILVEGTKWHDNFWGVCSCEECPGIGKNMLGQALMETRHHTRNEQTKIDSFIS